MAADRMAPAEWPGDDRLTKIITTAIEMAAIPPRRRDYGARHVQSALIPWALINRLRDELEDASIDWWRGV